MYRVQLTNFEGPLDLLLFFIKRDELDIYDIPIAYITDQFLEYLHFMDELDLGVASEFIYMASSLMSIKAKMMLPREEQHIDSEFDEADPRYDLVQSLLEFKRFKEMGEEMRLLDDHERRFYRRGSVEPDRVEPSTDSGELLRELTLFDLISAYMQVMNRGNRPAVVHTVELVKTSIEEQEKLILTALRTGGRQSFRTLIPENASRILIVVMFLAILEMIKEQKVMLYVDEDVTEFHLDLPSIPETVHS
jgi:segregation and condensation protein A